MIRNEWSRRNKSGETALDVVRKVLRKLHKYKREPVAVDNSHYRHGHRNIRRLSAPEEPRGTSQFLSQYLKGTYQHWLVSADIEEKIKVYKQDLENFNKQWKTAASLNGVAEKKEAIQDAIAQLEKVEEYLLEKGAKTFKELHPNIEAVPRTKDDDNEDTFKSDYNLDFSFNGVKDLTGDRKVAYIGL